jgi:hypothetical protein
VLNLLQPHRKLVRTSPSYSALALLLVLLLRVLALPPEVLVWVQAGARLLVLPSPPSHDPRTASPVQRTCRQKHLG